MKNFLNRFFPSRKKTAGGDVVEEMVITLSPVYRQRNMSETNRKSYATELLDTYLGFGSSYLAGYIKITITNQAIQQQMIKIARCLPLLKFFVNSNSRIYAVQPTRKFYLDGKEIIKTPTKKKPTKTKTGSGDEGEEIELYDPLLNKDKFVFDDNLFEILSGFYNDDVITAIKQSERYTNLLNTAVYKVITENGKIKLSFLPNDTVQVKCSQGNTTRAEQIAFIQDVQNCKDNINKLTPIIETWTAEQKKIMVDGVQINPPEDLINYVAREYEDLYGTKICGSAFAPFVVFRDSGAPIDFWDIKDNDIVAFIKSINCSLTELKYLEKFTSFGLKYTVNIKVPNDGVIDPNGFLQLAVENNSVPGSDNNKNFEVGEFENKGRIEEVIKSIIFNLKMLFSIYNIPLDALISTNSVRSAESKQFDNEALFDTINAQRDIQNNNEQNLFKVMCAVNNRDAFMSRRRIPAGVELKVNFDEQKTVEKTVDDWQVEIQNNVSTFIDWLSSINPDLDRDELMNLLKSNKEVNDMLKEPPLNVNDFAQVDEKGNLIIPKKTDLNKEEYDNNTNDS